MLASCAQARTESISVRHLEGTEHGFLALRTTEGKVLAVGDLYQVVHGDCVNARLVFHFKDGSIDDETTKFSQRGHFRLISDHHIQAGPSFPEGIDVAVDAARNLVTTRSKDKDGIDQVKSEHIDLPPDLVNGFILSVAKNILPATPQTTVSMLVASPKIRLIKVVFSPDGEQAFSFGRVVA